MVQGTGELTALGTRPGFNRTLRHVVSVTNIIEEVGRGVNLADIVNRMLDSDLIARAQIAPILSVALVGKYEYPFFSLNIAETVTDFSKITQTLLKWNAVNMILAYHSPNQGIVLINPANESHWQIVHDLKKDELMVAYAKVRSAANDVAVRALVGLIAMMEGREPVEDPAFTAKMTAPAPSLKPAGPALQPAAAQAAPSHAAVPSASAPPPAAPKSAPIAGKSTLTPKYSVQVTNELFHNGNVEAWKNIIESYEEKHSGCRVIVYHEGELIQDLNSLFKWGKVKHGGVILFQVAGANIKNVSKLQKYLHVGASSRFETFMKHDVNRTISLF